MNNIDKKPKSQGVAFEHWMGTITSFLRKKHIPLNLDSHEIYNLYHLDCTPKEVYQVIRTKKVNKAYIKLLWSDIYDSEETKFPTYDQVRKFYGLNPDVRKILEEGSFSNS